MQLAHCQRQYSDIPFLIFLNDIQILTLAVMTVVSGGTQEKRSATPWDAALAALAQDHVAWQVPEPGNSYSLCGKILGLFFNYTLG